MTGELEELGKRQGLPPKDLSAQTFLPCLEEWSSLPYIQKISSLHIAGPAGCGWRACLPSCQSKGFLRGCYPLGPHTECSLEQHQTYHYRPGKGCPADESMDIFAEISVLCLGRGCTKHGFYALVVLEQCSPSKNNNKVNPRVTQKSKGNGGGWRMERTRWGRIPVTNQLAVWLGKSLVSVLSPRPKFFRNSQEETLSLSWHVLSLVIWACCRKSCKTRDNGMSKWSSHKHVSLINRRCICKGDFIRKTAQQACQDDKALAQSLP